jgi:sulfate adenylyltransferase subunit 1
VRASLCWLGDTPLVPSRKYLLRHTTREVRARVERVDYRWNVSKQEREPDTGELRMNDIAQVTLGLAQPIFPDRYAENRATGSFIAIDEATNDTVAAGMIQ